MGSKHIHHLLIAVLLAAMAVTAPALAGIPTHFSYQGLIMDDGTPFTGDAQFKFALVDTSRNIYFWSSDGTVGMPTQSVTVPVQDGRFSVLLGQPPMFSLEPELVADFNAHQALRIWVDLGHGETPLGDLPLSTVLFADRATFAEQSLGSFTAGSQIWSRSGGFKFPDGTIQTTAATGGGSGGTCTLDEAYDGGGEGLGRFITADQGAVNINGSGGLLVEGNVILINKMGIGTFGPSASLEISTNKWDLASTCGDLMLGVPEFGLRMGMAINGEDAGTGRIRAVGGANRLYLGASTEDVVKIDSAGFHVQAGNFRVLDNGQTVVSGDFGGLGKDYAAILAENTYVGGTALWAETSSIAPAMAVVQNGTGSMFAGYEAGNLRFEVDGHGGISTTGLQVSEGPLQIDDTGKLILSGDFGQGTGSVAVTIDNTNPSGIAIEASSGSYYPTIVAHQTGNGDLFRGYDSQTTVFRVKKSGEVVTPLVTSNNVVTGTIEITGGSDLAEPFSVSETLARVEPGSIMAIDPDHPGCLKLCRRAYDTRVAGVVSGAGGVKPGLTLRQQGVLDQGRHLALSGRVYLRASTVNGPILPGDMMTSSDLPGVAMRATDREKSFGAVVGKAMTSLESGEGLVLVLVGLQ